MKNGPVDPPSLLLRLALPVPLWSLFDYLPPEGEDLRRLQPGQRFEVPFGRARVCGVLVALTHESEVPPERLRRAARRLDETPLLSEAHLDFLRWVADYYHHPPGEVICAALPVRLRKGLAPLVVRPERIRLTATPPDLKRAPRQQALVAWLQARGGEATLEALRRAFPKGYAAVRALERKGLVTLLGPEAPPAVPPRPPGFRLNAEQQAALKAVEVELHRFSVWLLQGVTGSGKTELYLQLARRVIERGGNVLLLVPEIALTPQLVRRFRRRLAVPTVLLHSGRSAGAREQAWRLAAAGEARLVIGTRSAVLAPVPRLGLVVVDEEHDASYKEQEGCRYSARDLAVVRARRAGCPVLLGSATPSLESLRNVETGRYRRLRLRRRAGSARPPALRILDVRRHRLEGGLSAPLLDRIEATLAQGHQVIVFLNRRGYAPVLSCPDCGWISDCPHCDARQTFHRARNRLVCHHCGHERAVPQACPQCGHQSLLPLGQGTERLEDVLSERFRSYPLVRIDRDTTAARGSLQRLLEQVREGRPGLLVGTQMLAKGHHFPRVALVALVDVDSGLFSADFRAPERLAQLIVQVAGRAGRGEVPGEVILQTRHPEHPLLQTLVTEGYDAFARQALEERREARLPPHAHQALLRASARKAETAEAFLQEAARLAAGVDPEDVAAWGPVPAPMQRRAGRHRFQLLFQADDRRSLQALLRALVPRLQVLPQAGRVRWSLDVDPVEMY